jgi:hypothetical protein
MQKLGHNIGRKNLYGWYLFKIYESLHPGNKYLGAYVSLSNHKLYICR